MIKVKLADVVVQVHIRTNTHGREYCTVRGLIVSIIMMPNALTEIIINVIVVILFL